MKKGRIRQSLRISFIEGLFASAMLGLTENFWVAAGEALKVTALKAGLVSTLPHLISSFLQITVGSLTEKLGGRLQTLKKIIALQWLFLLPLTLLPVISAENRYPLLLVCAIFFAIGGALPGPAWLSLMSDHLPPKSTGKYFGWRNRIFGLVSLVLGLFAGQLLQIFKKNILWGFALLFGIACILRFISWSLVIRMFDPKRVKKSLPNGNSGQALPKNFFSFLKIGMGHTWVRFVFFVGMFMFSVNITAPYLAVYMLRDLRYSYTTFSYVTFSATLAAIFGVKVWGELGDRFGHLNVIRATTLFISIIPLLWFTSGDPLWLVLVQICAGFVWSGFQLCSMTFAFSEISSEDRTHALGYLAALNGLGIFLGSAFGGFLVNVLPKIGHSSFLGLFLISALLRLLSCLLFFKKLKESRSVQSTTILNLYMDALGLYPLFQSGKETLEIEYKKKDEKKIL